MNDGLSSKFALDVESKERGVEVPEGEVSNCPEMAQKDGQKNSEFIDKGSLKSPGVFSQLECQATLADVNVHSNATLAAVGDKHSEKKACLGQETAEAPVDWLEPLEDDDEDEEEGAESWTPAATRGVNGGREAEVESLAGESERSESVAGSERADTRRGSTSGQRRRVEASDEWEDWPNLGEGWKRKVVFRRKGFSVGKTDTYYMSPSAERVRSKIELAKILAGALDLSTFDFKSGLFLKGRHQRKRKILRKEPSPSAESGFSSSFPLETKEFQVYAHRSDGLWNSGQGVVSKFHCRVLPAQAMKVNNPNQGSISPLNCTTAGTPGIKPHDPHLTPSCLGPYRTPGSPASLPDRHRSSFPNSGKSSSTKPPWGPGGKTHSNGKARPRDHTSSAATSHLCTNCGSLFTSMALGRPSLSYCPKCKALKQYNNRKIMFRKWLPCGHCQACLVTEDCGMCASCRNSLLNLDSPKLVRCRKRKCLCPIRKPLDASKQTVIHQRHEFEDPSVCLDEDEGDEEDVEGGPKRRNRRNCGKCDACNSVTDCGSCDFCMDKPKFGGSNKKRQKCRLRQCQGQGMLGRSQFLTQDGLGWPSPYYTYKHKVIQAISNPQSDDLEVTDEDDEHSMNTKPDYAQKIASLMECQNERSFEKAVDQRAGKVGERERFKDIKMYTEEGVEELEEVTPMITQIFSLADETHPESGIELDHELLRLLESLRNVVLPVLWFGIMVEGPRLQLLQCSKLSTMVDTVLHIDRGFYYQISVQEQPLLLTHPLYEAHPNQLTSVTQIVTLLHDLERFTVCKGVQTEALPPSQETFICERAAACDFLVSRNEEQCLKCRFWKQKM